MLYAAGAVISLPGRGRWLRVGRTGYWMRAEEPRLGSRRRRIAKVQARLAVELVTQSDLLTAEGGSPPGDFALRHFKSPQQTDK